MTKQLGGKGGNGFKPGKSGNPKGRPKGSKNKVGRPRVVPDPPTLPADEPLPELRPRELRLAMLYAEGGKSLAACCREVGFHPRSHQIHERVKHGDIGQVIAHRMRELGLTLDMPLLKIREFYDAKKEVQTVGIIQGEDGEPLRVSSKMELRDNDSQRWAAEQTLKLHGAYPKEDATPTGLGPAAVNIVFAQGPAGAVQGGIQIVTVNPGEGNGNGHPH